MVMKRIIFPASGVQELHEKIRTIGNEIREEDDDVTIDDLLLKLTSRLVDIAIFEETPPTCHCEALKKAQGKLDLNWYRPSQFDVFPVAWLPSLLNHMTSLKNDIADIETVVRNLNKTYGGTASD